MYPFTDALLLAATILVEGLVVFALSAIAGVKTKRLLLTSLVINIATQAAFSAWLKHEKILSTKLFMFP